MKNFSRLILILLVALSFSCSSDDSQIVESLWVDSERVSCTGEAEQTCYKIQESSTINENAWQLFYDSIEGFDELYEIGFIYKISITKVDIDNPPADASSIRYSLNKVLSKELDE